MIQWKNPTFGILKTSSSIGRNLFCKNAAGKNIMLSAYADDNIDVSRGDPLTYVNLTGEETVLVYFR